MWGHSISALYSKPRHRSIVLNDFCLLFHGIYRFCFDSFIQCCEDYASCIHCITNGMGLIHCLKKPINISLIHRITTSSVAALYSSSPFHYQVIPLYVATRQFRSHVLYGNSLPVHFYMFLCRIIQIHIMLELSCMRHSISKLSEPRKTCHYFSRPFLIIFTHKHAHLFHSNA